MFKRALEANHWMAIGLNSWNELENRDIPLSRVRKMRLLGKKSNNASDDESDESEVSSQVSVVEEQFSEADDNKSSASEAASDSGDEGTFVYCDVCPDRKFLTGKDIEDHLKSKMHMKRLASQSKEGFVAPMACQTPIPKPRKAAKKEVGRNELQPSEKSNRKARRAGIADTRTSH